MYEDATIANEGLRNLGLWSAPTVRLWVVKDLSRVAPVVTLKVGFHGPIGMFDPIYPFFYDKHGYSHSIPYGTCPKVKHWVGIYYFYCLLQKERLQLVLYGIDNVPVDCITFFECNLDRCRASGGLGGWDREQSAPLLPPEKTYHFKKETYF